MGEDRIEMKSFRNVIEGLKCCIVTEDTEVGKKLCALLYAVSEAIEKHYLRDFLILISTEETDNLDEVIEVYTLTFTYAGGGGLLLRSPSHEIVLSCESVTELRREVTGLLQRLDVLMNVLSPVPQSAFPYFKLTYYADTPNNYEPAGFKSSSTTYRFKKLTFISKILAGAFNTKFEGCSVYLESSFFGSTNEQHEKSISVDKDELQIFKRITDETPIARPKKDREIIKEDENNSSDSIHSLISSTNAQMKATADAPKENPDEAKKIISSCMEAVAGTTDLQKNDFSPEYSGDSEGVPESSGQFATFGSPSGPYINSPHTDSTFSLPTVAELVDRGSNIKKDSSIKSPSLGINISAELDTARELLMQGSSKVETLSNNEPKAKKMKISRSKLDYYKVIYFKYISKNFHLYPHLH
ncbi:unnamed protein product [Onchocerca flexuosa]|uniref:HORMA domain-containing protein n=1 Tax=Onchocerca flexuosa TaxID=387005 RepID=A0A183H3C8_9BILA|nr:unnamed protein product [Onchocerca flexuosa]